MSIKENPKIIEYSKGSDYVEIKFIPDYKWFKLNGLSDDLYNLFKKRVYDLAGVMGKKVQILFNNTELKINSFEDYAKLYFDENTTSFMIPY